MAIELNKGTLQFLMGEHKSLPTAISNGTVYVTTDEKAMYVDTLAGERIRLGGVVIYANAEELLAKTAPPYDTGALYFLSDTKALVAHDGEKWVHINDYSELGNKFTQLNTRIDTIINTTIPNIQTGVTNNANKLQALEETTIPGINTRIDAVIETNEAQDEEIAKIKEDISKMGTSAAIEALGTKITNLESAVNNETTGLDATRNIATAAQQTAGAALPKSEFTAFQSTNTTAIEDAKKAGTDAAAALEAYKTSNGTEITNIKSNITDLQNAQSSYLKHDGSVALTGDLSAGTHKITNIGAPTEQGDAANKQYVDTEVQKAKDAAAAADTKAGNAATAAGNAQTKADEAYTLADQAKTVADSKITMSQVEAQGYATTKYVDDELAAQNTLLTTEINAAKTAASNAQKAADAITEGAEAKTIKAVEDKIAGLKVSDLGGATNYATKTDVATEVGKVLGTSGDAATANTVYGAKAAAEAAQTAASNADSKAQGAVDSISTILDGASTLKTFKSVEDAINGLGNTYATDAELTSAISTLRGGYNDTLASLNTKIGENTTAITNLGTEVDELREDLLNKIQTADAMVYCGTVENAEELATKSAAKGGAEIGDTYKATKAFTLNGAAVKIGDLLIANGTEGEDGFIPSASVTWDHVESGYVADYNPKMTGTSITGGVKVDLTSGVAAEGTAGDLGSVQIIGKDGVQITTTAVGKDTVIQIGMTWGSF